VPEDRVPPAVLPTAAYSGFISTAGYGVTTIGNGAPGDLWVSWPSPPVESAHGQLELQFTAGTLISSFCRGDSGGPAYEGRQRGCPSSSEALRPRPIIGVSSYYYGLSSNNASTSQDASWCEVAPVMRFVDLTAKENHDWICTTTKGESPANGC
jgi:hypothetical protein